MLELPGRDEVDIFIDNQATIVSLTKPECISKTAYNCRLKLMELGKRHKTRLHWVRAHAGHALNEKVDELAKLGTESDKFNQVYRPKTDYNRDLLQKAQVKWED